MLYEIKNIKFDVQSNEAINLTRMITSSFNISFKNVIKHGRNRMWTKSTKLIPF